MTKHKGMAPTRKKVAGLVTGLALLFALAACSTTTQTATVTGKSGSSSKSAASHASNRAAVGQGLTITGDGGVKATVTLKSLVVHTTGVGDLAEKPKNGVYVVADIQIAVTAGSYDYNELYFNVVSSDGNSYDATDGNADTAGFDPTLESGTLAPGARAGGNVTFDVPAPHGTLQLTDPLSSVIGSWTF